MKEMELRRYATCSMCGHKIGKSQMPFFYRVTVECIGIKVDAMRRQNGMALMMGGNAMLAYIMGPDEEMTQTISGEIILSICADCVMRPTPIAQLMELRPVPPP